MFFYLPVYLKSILDGFDHLDAKIFERGRLQVSSFLFDDTGSSLFKVIFAIVCRHWDLATCLKSFHWVYGGMIIHYVWFSGFILTFTWNVLADACSCAIEAGIWLA